MQLPSSYMHFFAKMMFCHALPTLPTVRENLNIFSDLQSKPIYIVVFWFFFFFAFSHLVLYIEFFHSDCIKNDLLTLISFLNFEL